MKHRLNLTKHSDSIVRNNNKMETKNEIYFWKNFWRRLWNDFLRLKILLNVNQLQTFRRHLQ
jgi:hypothetical protein